METSNQTIRFSQTPGSRERQLRRQFNNPLFVDYQTRVTQQAVEQARADDLKEFETFVSDFQALLGEVAQLEGRVDTEVILNIKERIDQLYDVCACYEFDISQYQNALQQLYDSIMATIRRNAQDDALAIAELDKEQQARQLHLQLIEYKLVSDLLRDDSPIREDELIPTILSEDAETVKVVMTLFEPEQQALIREQAAHLIAALQNQGNLPEAISLAYEALAEAKQ